MVCTLALRSVVVETGCPDEDGRLVFARGRLVAVLVRLSRAAHPGEEHRDKWFLEAGFGPCVSVGSGVFPTLADAEAWVCGRLAADRRSRPTPCRPSPWMPFGGDGIASGDGAVS